MTALGTGVILGAVFISLVAETASAREFAIGGGIKVTLDDNWTGTSMQNPAMKFAGMKDMLDDATESRLRGPGSGVLISYMKFKTAKPAASVELDDGANVVRSARMIYGSQAMETEVEPVVHRTGETVRAYVTLQPKPGTRFGVAPGYPGGCVTTGTIRTGAAIHNVSIASETCDSASHRDAVAAIFDVGA